MLHQYNISDIQLSPELPIVVAVKYPPVLMDEEQDILGYSG